MTATASTVPAPQDVWVVGLGPAAFALGGALARAGLRVGLVGPHAAAPWPNNYGLFVDELARALTGHLPTPVSPGGPQGLGPSAAEVTAQGLCAHVWDRAEIRFDAAREAVLPRAYGQIDNGALRTWLGRDLSPEVVLEGAVVGVDHDASGSTVHLADGRRLRAAVVVDASGHRPVLARAPSRRVWGGPVGGRPDRGPGFQSALGWRITVPEHPFALDAIRLMDFGAVPGGDPRRPTFLYAMPFGPTEVFVEETSLCERPARDLLALEALLRARLAALGVTVTAVQAVECCFIPMGVGLPAPADRVVPFGGAAGLVHPATGYSLAHSLRAAPAVASAMWAAWDRGPAVVAQAAHGALWPKARKRAWAILHFGMEVLLGLDAPQLRDFFEAFCQVPEHAAFLSGEAEPAALAAVMRGVFARVPAPVRARLIAAGAHPRGWPMLGALAGADVWR